MPDRSVQKLGTTVQSFITVFNSSGALLPGQVNANFTKYLSINGVDSAQVVTVTEVDPILNPGQYVVTFIPNATGAWYLLVQNPVNNPRGWDETYDVTVDGAYTINDIFDKTDGVETGYTLRQALRLIGAVLCGKVSGAPLSPVFTNLQQTAPRVASVDDGSGNRTTVTLTP